MADSIRLQIVDAIAAELAQASVTLHMGTPNETTYTKPTGLNVHRMRLRPIEHDSLPSMIVYLLDSPKPNPRASGTLDRVVRVGIEARVQIAVAGAAPDDQMDPYEKWMVQAVMADEYHSGSALKTEEAETQRDFDKQGEVFVGRTAKAFDISYQTLRGDPEIKS